jgi:hypothetical protein
MNSVGVPARTLAVMSLLLLAACGGGSSNSPTANQPPQVPQPPTLDPQYRVSGTSAFAAGCDGVDAQGTLFANAEVEPTFATDPLDPHHWVAAWQQDRWSSGGARGVVVGVSVDDGHQWSQRSVAFTRCAGGNLANGGDYERASNPWISVGPDGHVHLLALAFDGFAQQPGSVSGILAVRSRDGGMTWDATTTLIRDTDGYFNDKGAILADPLDPLFVYAVWDRLTPDNTGPAMFSRSTDGGATWEAARLIRDPGVGSQTIDNIPVVLPNGTLVDLYTRIDSGPNGRLAASIELIRSTDNGVSWTAPTKIADELSVGTRDPDGGAPVRDSSLVPAIAVGPGGTLFVVWQDARFSAGSRDGIALSRSTDGGLTWSAPARVNADPAVPAFSPTATVRGDGTIGVTYYDFRPNTADRSALLTNLWLARSADTVAWGETQVAGPFNLSLAPQTTSPGVGGWFLGDYQGLASVGTIFVPMFARSNDGDTANRTDIYVAPAVSANAATAKSEPGRIENVPTSVPPLVVTDMFARRISENVERTLAARRPGNRTAGGPSSIP